MWKRQIKTLFKWFDYNIPSPFRTAETAINPKEKKIANFRITNHTSHCVFVFIFNAKCVIKPMNVCKVKRQNPYIMRLGSQFVVSFCCLFFSLRKHFQSSAKVFTFRTLSYLITICCNYVHVDFHSRTRVHRFFIINEKHLSIQRGVIFMLSIFVCESIASNGVHVCNSIK